ncbi:hypothetical protein AcW1_002287 [Taiwanofungus camphoratus]|nr:hypothetical protein AcV5_010290 [Antrodia cinnamomea]KAI0944619.1 hypothetical protein AcW1_002287 [Antrodia cinnamomea]KAI0946270.1 hypothetical protein AcV7_010292 [Antrodia cinnamomea]
MQVSPNRARLRSPQASILQDVAARDPCRLLCLPSPVLENILRRLRSKDILSLCAANSQLNRWSDRAYVEIHFSIGGGSLKKTYQTVASLHSLFDVLLHRVDYRERVVALSLYDTRSSQQSAVQSMTEPYQGLIRKLDFLLFQILFLVPDLQVFVLDATTTKQTLPLPQTIQALAHKSHLRDLALLNVSGPTSIKSERELASPKGLQRVLFCDVGPEAHWCNFFLKNQRTLGRLSLEENAKRDRQWLETLHRYARTWTSLETFAIFCHKTDLQENIMLIYNCLSTGAWRCFSSLSIAVNFGQSSIMNYLSTLRQTPLRRFRLVVSWEGAYFPDFGPNLMGGTLAYFPYLEELVLDHCRTTQYAPLPGIEDLVGASWGATLRAAPKLHKLTLPTLFVADPDEEENHDEDEDSWIDSEDIDMDDETVFGASQPITVNENLSKPTTCSEEIFPVLSMSLRRIYTTLAIFAEDFLDKYLRNPHFEELRFLHDNPDSRHRETLGFDQVWANDDGDQFKPTEFMIQRNNRKYDMFWESVSKEDI